SFAHNRTQELWQRFMKHRAAIPNVRGTELYSVEIFGDPRFFERFDPNHAFEKWAAVEVQDLNNIPDELEGLTLPSGMYAVFNYKGKSSEAGPTYQYIFTEWLPASGLLLDNRPHFALMGDKYKNDDPDSEEELWVPIRRR
ncbi:MAG: GyrI-like domain-containing protein, partial [Sinomicrobium sp.]|nr:GyrI-like domain-containing protein [Sinomicrobium sp.]